MCSPIKDDTGGLKDIGLQRRTTKGLPMMQPMMASVEGAISPIWEVGVRRSRPLQSRLQSTRSYHVRIQLIRIVCDVLVPPRQIALIFDVSVLG